MISTGTRATLFSIAVVFGGGIGGLIGDKFGLPAYVGLLVGVFLVFGLFLLIHHKEISKS